MSGKASDFGFTEGSKLGLDLDYLDLTNLLEDIEYKL